VQKSAATLAIVPFDTQADFCASEVRLADRERIASVVGLGDRPAADVAVVGAAEPLDQGGSSGHRCEEPVKTGDAQADGQAGVPPSELFVQDGAHAGALDRGEIPRLGLEVCQPQLAMLLEHLPERRPGRAHVRRIGEPVELFSGGAQDLLGKLVRRVLDRSLGFVESQLDVDQRHGHALLRKDLLLA
jgi:hypothetical protein